MEMIRTCNSKRAYRSLLTIASAALLCGGMALAQAGGSSGTSGTMQRPSPAGTPGNPQTDPSMQPGGMAPASGLADKDFVKKALEGGMAEVQMGQLAVQKGNSDDVKQFGQKMVDDHTKLGDEMKQVAQQAGVKPPSDVSKKDKKMLASLQGMSGDAFDQAYIKMMVKDHKTDDNDFKMEAQNGTIPEVKQAAAQGDQVISQHLQMIQQIAEAHHVDGSSKGMQ
jgi:putative membrane protein